MNNYFQVSRTFVANKEQRGFIREYSQGKTLPFDGVNHLCEHFSSL